MRLKISNYQDKKIQLSKTKNVRFCFYNVLIIMTNVFHMSLNHWELKLYSIICCNLQSKITCQGHIADWNAHLRRNWQTKFCFQKRP